MMEVNSTSWAFFPQNCGDNCRVGIDVFYFHFWPSGSPTEFKYHKNKGVEPNKYDWDGSRDGLFDDAVRGCKNGDKCFCTAIIQLNGWKIPSDYPYKF